MLKITEAAYHILLSAVEKEKKTEGEVLYVRLTMGIGWGGPQLKLSLEEKPLQEDQLITIDELNIVIHHQDRVYFENSKLDFQTDVLGKGRFQVLKM